MGDCFLFKIAVHKTRFQPHGIQHIEHVQLIPTGVKGLNGPRFRSPRKKRAPEALGLNSLLIQDGRGAVQA